MTSGLENSITTHAPKMKINQCVFGFICQTGVEDGIHSGG